MLFDALVHVGAVSSDNADDPTKVSLGRAARTDAGVHAAGNLVSLKLITQIPGVPDVVGAVNESLPPEIRVWGITRVQNSFNARTCVPRSPKWIFAPYQEAIDLAIVASTRTFSLPTSSYPQSLAVACTKHSVARQCRHRLTSSSSTNAGAFTDNIHSFWAKSPPESSKEDDLQRKRRWGAEPETIQRLREAAKKFEGTRNFHNFTVGREFSDRSTQRHMKKIEVSCLLRVLAATEPERPPLPVPQQHANSSPL